MRSLPVPLLLRIYLLSNVLQLPQTHLPSRILLLKLLQIPENLIIIVNNPTLLTFLMKQLHQLSVVRAFDLILVSVSPYVLFLQSGKTAVKLLIKIFPSRSVSPMPKQITP